METPKVKCSSIKENPKPALIKVGIIAFLLGMITGAFVYYVIIPKTYMLEIRQQPTSTSSTAHWNAEIIIIVKGEMSIQHVHNVYTDIGKRFERNHKTWGNETGYLGWVSLSNDANPSASWTKLPNEASTAGAGRKAFDSRVPMNFTAVNSTVTFTFTGTITLQCAGIQWSGTGLSDNNLYAAFAFTQTTFNANDKLIIKYYNNEYGT